MIRFLKKLILDSLINEILSQAKKPVRNGKQRNAGGKEFCPLLSRFWVSQLSREAEESEWGSLMHRHVALLVWWTLHYYVSHFLSPIPLL